MALLKKKTRKVLTKELRRLVGKHGSKLAISMLAGLVTEFLATVLPDGDKAKSKPKAKSKAKRKK